MRLTSFTDFGLRMLMRMAGEPTRAFSTAEFAREFGLSRNHLAKVMQRLAEGGLIETRRGSGGGAILALPPNRIKLGTVVNILEDGHSLVECFVTETSSCTLDGRCRLKARLRSAESAFYADLDLGTLADIALPPQNH